MSTDSLVHQASRSEVNQQTIDPGIAAVQVSGELDLATVGTLEAGVERALTQGSAPLLIDLTGCEFIDSSVVSLLVDLRVRLGNSGRQRFAVVAEGQPLRVMRLTGLDHEMPVFPSLPEALGPLKVAGAGRNPGQLRRKDAARFSAGGGVIVLNPINSTPA
jgi:anti-anti-sigma factor